MDILNLSYFDQREKMSREVEKIIILGEKIFKSVSVKQYSITKRSGVYDQCNGNYTTTPAGCTLYANYSFN